MIEIAAGVGADSRGDHRADRWRGPRGGGAARRSPCAGLSRGPKCSASNRNGIYVFVNRRLVRDRLLLHAIHEAYRNILPADVFPVALLFVDLPCEEVDVNVHPAKIEVRFRHSQFVHDFARDAIRQALGQGAAGCRALPATGRAAAGGSASRCRGWRLAPRRLRRRWRAARCDSRSDPYAGMAARDVRADGSCRCSRRRSASRSSRRVGSGLCSRSEFAAA